MKPIKMPPDGELPSFSIESIHGSEEETAKAEIEIYGSTNIDPKKNGRKIQTRIKPLGSDF